jgi:hypothetical protein
MRAALPGFAQENTDICFVEEQVIAIYQALFVDSGQGSAERQLQLTVCVGGEDITLGKPKRFVLDAQIAGAFIKGADLARVMQDDL